MKLALKPNQQKPSETAMATEQQRPQRYSIWSDLEALKFLEQTRKDVHTLEKKIRRTRLVFALGAFAGGLLFACCFGLLSLTYTEMKILKQQLPSIPEKISDAGTSTPQIPHLWEV